MASIQMLFPELGDAEQLQMLQNALAYVYRALVTLNKHGRPVPHSAHRTPPSARAIGSPIGMKGPSSIPANAKSQASTCGSAGHGLRKAPHYGKGEWDVHRGVDGRGAAASRRGSTTQHR